MAVVLHRALVALLPHHFAADHQRFCSTRPRTATSRERSSARAPTSSCW